MSNLGILGAVAIAAAACALVARRSIGAGRRMWTLLGAAMASWAAGQATWTYYETVLQRPVPFPSLADVGYLGAVPLGAASLLALLAVGRSAAGAARAVLDGFMVGASLLFAGWILVLERLIETGSGTPPAEIIGLAYPLGDVVLITLALFSLAGRPTGVRSGAYLLIGLGWLAIAVADIGFAYLTLTDSYSSGSLIDVGWLSGFMLVFCAARHPAAPTVGTETGIEPVQARPVGLILPYMAVMATAALALAWQLITGRLDDFLVWDLIVIFLLLVIRQVLTLRENLFLTRHLEARVEQRTAELHASEQRFRSLVQNSSEVVTVVDDAGVVTYQSETITSIFGHDAAKLLDSCFADIVFEEDRQSFVDALRDAASSPGTVSHLEVRIPDASGNLCRAAITLNNLLYDASVRGVVLNTRDISEQKTLEEQLAHQAFHDTLTALANRALFKDRVEQSLRRRMERGSRVAVLFLDLDGFKQVNDTLGHGAGDGLLVEVARRIRRCVRPVDTVARLGGDEFAVLVEEARGRADVRVAETILRELQRPFEIEGREIFVRGSMGIATSDADVAGADQLLRNADLAMYRAKARREGGYERYDPGMHVQLVRRVELEADLRRAVSGAGLSVVYQPTVALGLGELVGLEALVRWNHPNEGMIPPARFIPLAEETGVIHELGRFVLRQACIQVAAWNSGLSVGGLSVGVNVSAEQLRRPDIVREVAEALEESGLSPGYLTLEMTESVLLRDEEETIRSLERLKELGVQLAIDDFGTGYSSLSYLHRLPVDILKIDRSFIDQLRGKGDKDQLVRAIVRLGHGLDLRTIAEGIEDHVQYLALARMGCQFGQGYYFWPPLHHNEIEAILTTEMATAGN